MKRGLAPVCRHDGSPFSPHDHRYRMPPGSMVPRAALLQARGDWEWLCQCFRFRHFQNEHFWFLCDTTQTGPNSYFNLAPDAPHRQTSITHERWEAKTTNTDSNTKPFASTTMC